MSIDWSNGILIASVSGTFAGVVNQGAGALRERFDRAFKLRQEGAEREHQASLRRQQAHSEARSASLEHVRAVRQWVDDQLVDTYPDQLDYLGVNRRRSRLGPPADAVEALVEVSMMHPTRAVRDSADSIESSIDDAYNVPAGDRLGPSLDLLFEWRERLGELAELIHDPEL